jgi:predicted RNase H-like HicB family nuclease
MAHPKKPSRSVNTQDLRFNIETERETDGRWIAEISDMPGVLAYGNTEAEARAKAYALALRVIADDDEKSKESSDGDHRLTPDDPAFEKKMAKAGEVMSRYRNTLHALSK